MAGKVIVITGANGGFGRALARRFAADGERLFLLVRSLDKVRPLADELGPGVTIVQCDTSSPASVRIAFEEVARSAPRIDVLINNAAVMISFLIEAATDAQITEMVMTNLAGPIACARSAIPLLGTGGHIINVSSEAVEVTFPFYVGYQATKAGLERFTQSLNWELEDRGIRVTTVRAGQMRDPQDPPRIDPVEGARFFAESARRGIHLAERGTSDYASATHIFRAIIDSPPDLQIGLVSLRGRPIPRPAEPSNPRTS